jgi:hypothetical protein
MVFVDIESCTCLVLENTYLIKAFDLAFNSLLSIHKYQNISFFASQASTLHRRSTPIETPFINHHPHINFETYNSSYPTNNGVLSDPPLLMPHTSSLQHSHR